MKVKEAFVKAVYEHYDATGEGLDEEDLIRIIEEWAITDEELREDIKVENQRTLRIMGKKEARSRKRYIAKESRKFEP